MAVHIHPIDVPARFYKPIGQVMVGWNLAEALVCSIVWHIHGINNPVVGRLFTYRHNSVEKLEILLASAQNHVTDPILHGTLTRLYGEANKLRKERNKLAHGLWGRMPKEPSNWKVFYPKEADDKDNTLLKREEKTLNDLVSLASRMRKLNKDLGAFMAQNRIPPP